jgi:hypothetical protein
MPQRAGVKWKDVDRVAFYFGEPFCAHLLQSWHAEQEPARSAQRCWQPPRRISSARSPRPYATSSWARPSRTPAWWTPQLHRWGPALRVTRPASIVERAAEQEADGRPVAQLLRSVAEAEQTTMLEYLHELWSERLIILEPYGDHHGLHIRMRRGPVRSYRTTHPHFGRVDLQKG